MAKSYYSTVFVQSASRVWSVERDFNAYPVLVDGARESEIEGRHLSVQLACPLRADAVEKATKLEL